MNRKIIIYLSLVFGIFCGMGQLKANHLFGGSIDYTYVKDVDVNGTKYKRYHVVLRQYGDLNCYNPGSNCTTFKQSDGPLTLGVYYENPSLASSTSFRRLYTTISADKTNPDKSEVFPPVPPGCPSGPNNSTVKVDEGIWEGDVDLEPSGQFGYYIIFETSTRRPNALNYTTNSKGTSFLAYIPPTVSDNNSAYFNNAPIPQICTKQFSTFLNTATDVDGDQLLYSFSNPYDVTSDYTFGSPYFPANEIEWPIPQLQFQPGGYSLANLLNAPVGNQATIDPSTGLSSLYAPNNGEYVIALEIKEYRNSVLVGFTRRDLVFFAGACSVPPPPATFTPTSGSAAPTSTGNSTGTLTIQEGEKVDFRVTFTANNASDPVSIIGSGQLFDPTKVNPPATLSGSSNDVGQLSNTFTWQTKCGQGSANPYTVLLSGSAGCSPVITNNYLLKIYVKPPSPTLSGTPTVCPSEKGKIYSVSNFNPTSSYNVNFSNPSDGVKTVTSPSSISVDWKLNGKPGTVISVLETNKFGCSRTGTYAVNVGNSTTVEAGTDQYVCSKIPTAPLGPPAAALIPGATYTWTGPSTAFLNNPNIPNPTATFDNNTQINSRITYTLNVITPDGCSATDKVDVYTYPKPDASPVNPTITGCSGFAVQGGPKKVPGNSYTWSPSPLINDITLNQPNFTPTVSSEQTFVFVVTVTASPSFGSCKNTGTLSLVANPNPTVVISAPANSVCPKDPVQLTALGTNSYTWFEGNPSQNKIVGNTPDIIVAPSVVTTYFARGFEKGCFSDAAITVTPNGIPSLSIISSSNQICAGGAASLTAGGAVSYSWAISTSPNSPFAFTNKININPSATTTYIVTGIGPNGCGNSMSKIITVNPLPIITIDNSGVDSICRFSKLALKASGATIYTWFQSYAPNTAIATGASVALTVPFTSTFVVEGEDSKGCINRTSKAVFAWDLPATKINTLKDTACAGTNIKLAASGGLTYQWYQLPAPGVLSTASFVYTTLSTNQAFVLRAENEHLCVANDTLRLIVSPSPTLVMSSSPNNPTPCASDLVRIDVSGAKTYKWYNSSALADSALVSNNSTFFARPTTTVVYYVLGSNAYGCTAQGNIQVNVLPKPGVKAISGANFACTGGAEITYKAIGGAANSIYTWISPGGKITQGQGTPSVAVQWSTKFKTQLRVVETNVNQCKSDTISLPIELRSDFTPAAPIGLSAICLNSGGTATYTIPNYSASGITYKWMVNGGGTIISNNQQSIVVSWPSGITGSVQYTSSFDGAGNASCIFTSAPLLVQLNPIPSAGAIVGPVKLCAGSQANYSLAGLPGSTYKWTIDPQSTGGATFTTTNNMSQIGIRFPAATNNFNLFVQETSNKGCVGKIDTLSVVVNAVPGAPLLVGDTLVCSGFTNNILYTANFNLGSTYIWNVSNGTLNNPANTGNVISVNWNTGSTAGQVSVQEQNSLGCKSKATILNIQFKDIAARIEAVGTKIDNEKHIVLSWKEALDGFSQSTYQIYRRVRSNPVLPWGGPIKSVVGALNFVDTDPNLRTDNLVYEYKYKVKNACSGLEDSPIHNTILLVASSQNVDNSVSLKWNKYQNFSKGLYSYQVFRKLDDEQNFKLYAEVGKDTVVTFQNAKDGFKHVYRIRAIDNSSQNESWSNDSTVNFKLQVQVPNTFTPNGDGVNDTWKIKSIEAFKNNSIEIFNRTGQVVYSNISYSNSWNGTSTDGRDLPAGTYFYVIKLNDARLTTGENTLSGNVTIVR